MIKTFWSHLTFYRKQQLVFLFILMLFASMLEVISIGSVVPFLGALTNPEILLENESFEVIFSYLNITDSDKILMPLTILFISASILSGSVRLLLLYLLTRLSFGVGADLSIECYRRTLYQDYDVHLARNSSTVINGVINQSDIVIKSVLTPALMLLSSILFLVGIVSVLLFINFYISLFSFIFFALLYGGVIWIARKNLDRNSIAVATNSRLMIKSIQEGLGGIRDIILKRSHEFYCSIYRTSDLKLRRAAGNNIFIANSPKYIIESIGICFIAILAFYLVQESNSPIALLGVLALGMQRLLPILQQIYSSYSSMMGAKASFAQLMQLLQQEYPESALQKVETPIKFSNEIQLKDVSFRYEKNGPWVLKDVNLKIIKGSHIGIIGTTGSGKSTLVDIVMGLLLPTKGEMWVDQKKISHLNKSAWQLNISHVPQSIYLSDSSIASNIAFGTSNVDIDQNKIITSASIAQISNTIEMLDEQYETEIGEHGIKLSGGQKQRVGLARALYNQSPVLVLDEATSALDDNTEKAVMNAIDSLDSDITIITIAHRLSTLKKCDAVFRVDSDGSIKELSQGESVNDLLYN
jgi:ATP-binding cassette, subfamily B, bacterial PglK